VKGSMAAEAIVFIRSEHGSAPVHKTDGIAVSQCHTLRNAGRSGGIEDVGYVVRMTKCRQSPARFVLKHVFPCECTRPQIR